MKHILCCSECYEEICELKPDEVGPGHRKIEECANGDILYTGSDACDRCEDWDDDE